MISELSLSNLIEIIYFNILLKDTIYYWTLLMDRNKIKAFYYDEVNKSV
jgi:hypothetical protein